MVVQLQQYSIQFYWTLNSIPSILYTHYYPYYILVTTSTTRCIGMIYGHIDTGIPLYTPVDTCIPLVLYIYWGRRGCMVPVKGGIREFLVLLVLECIPGREVQVVPLGINLQSIGTNGNHSILRNQPTLLLVPVPYPPLLQSGVWLSILLQYQGVGYRCIQVVQVQRVIGIRHKIHLHTYCWVYLYFPVLQDIYLTLLCKHTLLTPYILVYTDNSRNIPRYPL